MGKHPNPALHFLTFMILWILSNNFICITCRSSSGAVAFATFNVLNYRAKGNGVSDDTKAFGEAWAAACGATGSVVVVPPRFVFLVGPITFSGLNCHSNIVFQIRGTIIAPTSSGPWGSGYLQWLNFKMINGITIEGGGTIDGQGSIWWKSKSSMPSTKPTALRFYGSTNVKITGITMTNSPRTHLKFDSCNGVQVFGISISSPGNSPNTDGIHLQNSQNVAIRTSTVACGDDCISIQTGCSGVLVDDVDCGPGHGISIGGLGPDRTKACVSNVTVSNSRILNTQFGVRIKTWQGGLGIVKGVTFKNIQVMEVGTPIDIEQYYCNRGKCANQTSAVAVSGVTYESIQGTYKIQPIRFACSDSVPCSGIRVSGVLLRPSLGMYGTSPFCWNAFGQLPTETAPPISCLRAGNPLYYGRANSCYFP